MRKALLGTSLVDLSDTFIECEKEYGVNAFFLAALAAHEGSWGKSDRARTQNNLTGYAVYSNSSAGVTFSSKDEGIHKTASLIADQYLNPKGKYYKGSSLYDVNIEYCRKQDKVTIDYGWSASIANIMNQLVEKANS